MALTYHSVWHARWYIDFRLWVPIRTSSAFDYIFPMQRNVLISLMRRPSAMSDFYCYGLLSNADELESPTDRPSNSCLVNDASGGCIDLCLRDLRVVADAPRLCRDSARSRSRCASTSAWTSCKADSPWVWFCSGFARKVCHAFSIAFLRSGCRILTAYLTKMI